MKECRRHFECGSLGKVVEELKCTDYDGIGKRGTGVWEDEL